MLIDNLFNDKNGGGGGGSGTLFPKRDFKKGGRGGGGGTKSGGGGIKSDGGGTESDGKVGDIKGIESSTFATFFDKEILLIPKFVDVVAEDDDADKTSFDL